MRSALVGQWCYLEREMAWDDEVTNKYLHDFFYLDDLIDLHIYVALKVALIKINMLFSCIFITFVFLFIHL